MHPTGFLVAALLASALVLSACKEAPVGEAQRDTAQKSRPVTVAAIAAEGKGFDLGSPMSKRVVYVFFDPQCPHCAALWMAAKPLKSQARFVWMPVALVNASSAPQGAALLAAPDPVAAMDEHEASLRAKQGGIGARGELDAQKAVVAGNTKLMTSMGFSSVPAIVGTHAQSGVTVSQEGSMPTAALANLLGLQAPAAN